MKKNQKIITIITIFIILLILSSATIYYLLAIRNTQAKPNINNNVVSYAVSDNNFQQSTQNILAEIDTTIKSDNKFIFVPVLEYHYIREYTGPVKSLAYELSVTPANFEMQMKYLYENHYVTLDMASLLYLKSNNIKIPEKSIVITFDDGHRSVYTTVLPVIKKYNFHIETYIITNYPTTDKAFMSWDMIKSLLPSGLVTIGGHTVHHPNLSNLTSKEIDQELKNSKDELEARLNIKITDFSYPYGNYNSTIIDSLVSNQYTNAVTGLLPGDWSPIQNPFTIHRQYITGYSTFEEFKQKVN